MDTKKPSQGLWTWDFTIITVGSIISLIGGVLSTFAMSIMVLDYTGSVFLYALFNAAYRIPMLVCPVLAGPYLDRMSRKKAVYGLDFLSAGMFAALALLLGKGWFSFPALLCFNLLRGGVDSVYLVAYDSLYPNLVDEGNLSKAYAVSGMLQSIMLMAYPLGALAYDALGGVAPLFAATQSYLPDEKRARFNGAYQMLTSLGSLGGTLLAGWLAEVMPERGVILLFSAVGLAAAWLFIFRRRREVAAIYNREV